MTMTFCAVDRRRYVPTNLTCVLCHSPSVLHLSYFLSHAISSLPVCQGIYNGEVDVRCPFQLTLYTVSQKTVPLYIRS